MPELEKKFDQLSMAVKVAYIGPKEIKKDTLCRSGVVWFGTGDVQSVDPRVASVLLKHQDVFIRAEDLEDHLEAIEDEVDTFDDEGKQSDDNELNAGTVVDEPLTNDDADSQSSSEDPTYPAEHIEKVKAAIIGLDPSNENHFNKNKTPKVPAVRTLVTDEDIEVTADLVKAAFQEIDVNA